MKRPYVMPLKEALRIGRIAMPMNAWGRALNRLAAEVEKLRKAKK